MDRPLCPPLQSRRESLQAAAKEWLEVALERGAGHRAMIFRQSKPGIKNNNNKPASIFTLGKCKKPQMVLSDPCWKRTHFSFCAFFPHFPNRWWCLIWVKYCWIIAAVPSVILRRSYDPHFTDEETEAQRGPITHPSSCSGGRDTKPISLQSRICCRTLVKEACDKCCFSLNLCNGTCLTRD